MRNGFLRTVAFLLASASAANAQQGPTSLPQTTLPDPIVQPKAPDLSKGRILAPETISCCETSSDRPLGLWLNADYLLWWIKGAPVNTPLVTSGNFPAVPPGALGQPNTQVLYGDRPLGYGSLSGVRLGGGFDLADNLALEGNYFLLQRGATHFAASADPAGNPLIARPFFNTQLGLEDALGTSTSSPILGPFSGTTSVTSYSQLQGWELNLATRDQLSNNWSFGLLGGFRALNLNEDLIIQDSLTPLPGSVLTFLGTPIGLNSTLSDIDRFHTSNNFYGGQIGGRAIWQDGAFSVTLLGKVALGVNQQIAIIDGSTTLATPGAPSNTAPGGVLALPTNIGRYYRSVFSVVPEGALNLGWNITPRVKATMGYTFMYWSNVARPGNQIDRNLNSSLIPSSQAFGNGLGGGNRPGFSFQESGFWAQGINFGVEFKF